MLDIVIFVLRALLQKLVGEFLIWEDIWREIGWISSDPQNKVAQKYWGKFRSIFRENIRASKKHFVPTLFCRRATRNYCDNMSGHLLEHVLTFFARPLFVSTDACNVKSCLDRATAQVCLAADCSIFHIWPTTLVDYVFLSLKAEWISLDTSPWSTGKITVCAKITTELILERAGLIILIFARIARFSD